MLRLPPSMLRTSLYTRKIYKLTITLLALVCICVLWLHFQNTSVSLFSHFRPEHNTISKVLNNEANKEQPVPIFVELYAGKISESQLKFILSGSSPLNCRTRLKGTDPRSFWGKVRNRDELGAVLFD